MLCGFCGSIITVDTRPLRREDDDDTEMNIAAFRQGTTVTLLFVPLKEDRVYRIYHCSRQHGSHMVKEQGLYGKHMHARVVMMPSDSLLLLGMRVGFPSLRVECTDDGIIRMDSDTSYLNVTVGDIEVMSRFLEE